MFRRRRRSDSCSKPRRSFSYKKTRVLSDVNLDVHQGEICALIGDNGAGKSTLSRIVVGEFEPTSGKSLPLERLTSGLKTGACRLCPTASQNG